VPDRSSPRSSWRRSPRRCTIRTPVAARLRPCSIQAQTCDRLMSTGARQWLRRRLSFRCPEDQQS
jgi:hypothetical protein